MHLTEIEKIHLLLSLTGLSISGYCQEGSVLKNKGIKKLSVLLGTWKGENKPRIQKSNNCNYKLWMVSKRQIPCL